MADNIHAKRLESLTQLTEFAGTLDPAKLNAPPDLLTAALQTLNTEGHDAQETVSISKGGWRTAALDRAADAGELASKAAESLALLEARGASAETIEDGRSYVRKLQGKRASPKPVDDPATPDIDESEKAISAAQTSNAARIATFLEFLKWLEEQPEYAGVTNAGKTIADLQTFGEAVETKHNSSIAAVTKLSSDRIERNKIFYDNADSNLSRAKRLKKLIGGTYGFDSPEYQTANAIPFRKPNK